MLTQKTRIFLLFGALLVFVGGGLWWRATRVEAPPSPVDVAVETYTVSTTTIVDELPLSGTLMPIRSATVSAKVGGRLSALPIERGDVVLQNTLLAQLAGDEHRSNLVTARTQEFNVVQTIDAQQAYLDEQVLAAEEALRLVKVQLTATQDDTERADLSYEEQVALAETAVEQAQTGVENTEAVAAQRMDTLYDGARQQFRSALVAATNAMSFAQEILPSKPAFSFMDDKFEPVLGSLNTQTKIDAEGAVEQTQRRIDTLEDRYDNEIKNTTDISREQWDTHMRDAVDALEQVQDMLQDMNDMFDATPTTGNVSKEIIQQWRATLAGHASAIDNALLFSSDGQKGGVKGFLLSKDALETRSTTELRSARQALLQAKQALADVQAQINRAASGSTNAVVIAEQQVVQAQQALAAAKAQRSSALKDLQMKVEQVRGDARLSQIAVDNTQVGAPFAGVITKKYVEVGQVVGVGQPVADVADTSLFKIHSAVPDTRAPQLHTGLEAIVKIDGLDDVYTASVTKVAPAVDPVSRKVEIELTLNETPENARIGMFARVQLQLPARIGYRVPARFVHADARGSYVLTEHGERIPVTLGADVDGMYALESDQLQNGTLIRPYGS